MSPAQLEQDETSEHPPRPLPARGMQQRAHRLVLGRMRLRLTRLRHQGGRVGQRIRQSQSAAAAGGGARGSWQERRSRQRPRRAMAIERSAD